MNYDQDSDRKDTTDIHEILSGSGYSNKAIEYYLNQPHMGSLADANQVTELTGTRGDTMKVYLEMSGQRIQDAKIQVLGCPGAVASAMVAMELARGKTIEEAWKIKDRDIFQILESMPDQKQHCIRLAVKTLRKALEHYDRNNSDNRKGDSHATV